MILLEEQMSKWAVVFSAIGNEDRLSVMLALHSSDYIKHSHKDNGQTGLLCGEGCLSFSQIQRATGISSDTSLSYHLSKLIEAKLIEKLPTKDANERVFPLYRVSAAWQEFAASFGITNKIKEYIQHKHPNQYIENTV